MAHFKRLIQRYKLVPISKTDKCYYYFNEGSKLWIEETTDDSVITKICKETELFLTPKKFMYKNSL